MFRNIAFINLKAQAYRRSIKNNLPEEGIVIEDTTDPEKNVSHEFKTTEIFKASDMMVDSLIRLLERERQKKS